LLAAEREASGDELLLRTVYAAAYHGQLTPSARPENEARANYLIALAQPATGWPAAAMGAADRCLVVCEQHGLADFAVDPVI